MFIADSYELTGNGRMWLGGYLRKTGDDVANANAVLKIGTLKIRESPSESLAGASETIGRRRSESGVEGSGETRRANHLRLCRLRLRFGRSTLIAFWASPSPTVKPLAARIGSTASGLTKMAP